MGSVMEGGISKLPAMSESALWALNPSRTRQTVPFVRSGVQGPRAEARGRQKNVNVV